MKMTIGAILMVFAIACCVAAFVAWENFGAAAVMAAAACWVTGPVLFLDGLRDWDRRVSEELELLVKGRRRF